MNTNHLLLITKSWAPMLLLSLFISSCESPSPVGDATSDGIHLEENIANVEAPPFTNCEQMENYFNTKYAAMGIKTTFTGFAGLEVMKKNIDYNANAISTGNLTLDDSVLTCSGGTVTYTSSEYIKKCADSNMFFYTFVGGKTFLAWSERGQVDAPNEGNWMNIGSLDSDVSRGECSFSW